jgi:hypothetical protein
MSGERDTCCRTLQVGVALALTSFLTSKAFAQQPVAVLYAGSLVGLMPGLAPKAVYTVTIPRTRLILTRAVCFIPLWFEKDRRC